MKYLMLMLFTTVSISITAVAQDFNERAPKVVPPPETKSLSDPVPIQEDFEGAKELSALHKKIESDQYFLLLKTAKAAKIEEMIADSQNKTAKSRAEIAELNSPKLNAPVVLPSAIQTGEEKPKEVKKPVIKSDPILNGLSLVGIKSSTSVVLKNQTGFFEATYNKPVNGLLVTAISSQSATIKSLKSGQLKVISLSSGEYIKPDMPAMKKKEQ